MGWRLNLGLIQQQIDEARGRQLEGVSSRTTLRTPAWDRWTPHRAKVIERDGRRTKQTYPHYLSFTDERLPNRAQRRANDADTRHRERGPGKRKQQRQFAVRNRTSRLLIKPAPTLVKRRKPA